MKHFFKKLLALIEVAIIIGFFVYIFFLAATDQWIKLARFSFFIGFGGIIAILEIPQVIIWRLKKIIKENDFD